MQSVPPIYIEEAHTFTNQISVKFQPEVDQYKEMERDAKSKAADVLAKKIRSFKEAMRNLQTFRGAKALNMRICVFTLMLTCS